MLKNVGYFRDRSRTLFTVSSLRCSFFFLRPLLFVLSSSSSSLGLLLFVLSAPFSSTPGFVLFVRSRAFRSPLSSLSGSKLFVQPHPLRPVPNSSSGSIFFCSPRPHSCASASFLCLGLVPVPRPRFCASGLVSVAPALFAAPALLGSPSPSGPVSAAPGRPACGCGGLLRVRRPTARPSRSDRRRCVHRACAAA